MEAIAIGELEAQFAAFEVRAVNGFGMFDESGDAATAAGPATAVDVSISQEPTAVAQRSAITTVVNQSALAQKPHGAKEVGTWIGGGQRARTDMKSERAKEGKDKRNRYKGKKRDRP